MSGKVFPKIQRGNGVMNDNLATLGDIMAATLEKVHSLEGKIEETKQEVAGVNKSVSEVKKTIQDIDKENTPREKKSFKLLIASVIISIISLVLAYLALR